MASLAHINYYTNDVISAVQGWIDQKHQVFDSNVHTLKWLPPSLPGEAKDLVSVKKILAREGDWECVKEVLGWIINTEAGTLALP